MLSKIKNNIVTTLVAAALLIVPALMLAAPASAADLTNSLCTGANTLQVNTDGSAGSGCAGIAAEDGNTLNDTITLIINVFSMVVGLIAVIMIIVGGLKYITSGGDSGKVTSAKNSIIYAVIGLVIVALAQVIVRFVLSKATTA